MAPTTQSPNVDNLQVGKGIVEFMLTGTSTFRPLGNVSELTITPQADVLEHFSSMEGTKKKDLQIVLDQKATVKIVMEEFTPDNLALMIYGDVDFGVAGGPEVEIFANSAVTGRLRFTGTNDVGPKVTADLYKVSFTPTGDLKMISAEFNTMEVVGDVLAADAAPVAASQIYTVTGAIADADTITIGGHVYTFKTAIAAAGDVHRTGVVATDLSNLAKAINGTGVVGTDYETGTVVNADVTAASDGTHLYVTAILPGTAGNAITTTDTSTGGAWGGATLLGGLAVNPFAGKFGVAKFTNTIVN